MKLIFKLTALAIVLYIVWSLFSPGGNKEPLISFNDQPDNFSVKIRGKEKEELKRLLAGIKSFIYREASIHNPEGDILPDEVDDRMIEKVKDKVN